MYDIFVGFFDVCFVSVVQSHPDMKGGGGMKTKLSLLTLAITLCAGARPLLGHHAFSAEFDSNKPVKLRGTVTKMEWVNPHAWLYIDVKGADGKITSWAIEGAAPNAMLRRGFTKDSLPVGTEIIVEGYQAKDGSNISSGQNLTLPDGRKLFMGSTGVGAPDEPK
jgi:hypothetical protein